MSGRVASWLAWSLSMLCVAMFLAIVALYVLIRSAPQVPGSVSTRFTLTDLLIGVSFLAFPMVGALIASRRPNNPIGWICLTVGFLFLLFPDGRLPSRRWRPLAWLSGAVIVVLSLGFGLAPGPVASLPRKIGNPFGLEGFPWLSDAANVSFPLLALCILASVVSLVLRYRRSRDEEREQIKWIAFAASVVGLLFLTGLVISLIYGSKPPSWTRLLDTMTALSYTGVPRSEE